MKILLIIMTVTAVVYVTNFIKIAECDFESPYRCEFIHGVGLIPPLSFITVWFESDEK